MQNYIARCTQVFLSHIKSIKHMSLQTHVKRVSQRSAKSRGFSPGAQVSSHRES
jgi:endonuclease III